MAEPRGVAFARIDAEPVTVEECSAAAATDADGAVATFAGVVRDHDGGRAVVGLGYEAHPEAAAVLARVAEEVAARHPGVAIACAHRVGVLRVGDIALAAAAASPHRAEAFAACAELVDAIKEQVPIWKEQAFSDGTSEWVGAL